MINMTKLLLTGATGFIGRACLDALVQNTDWEIHALYRKRQPIHLDKVIWHECDILQQQNVTVLIRNICPNYLIHLAWIVDHQVFWSSETNIDHSYSTIHLYKQFSLHGGVRAIFLGSCSEYDNTYQICDEDTTPLKPNTLYGVCKKQTFELLTKLKANCPEYADFSWVRTFNLFGPNEFNERLLPYIFNSYLQKKSPVLNNPNIVRDHSYIENLGEWLICLLKSKHQSAINFGSNNVLSITKLANLIHQQFFPEQAPPIESKHNNELEDIFLPKLTKVNEINVNTFITFENSLEKTYQWWKNKIKG